MNTKLYILSIALIGLLTIGAWHTTTVSSQTGVTPLKLGNELGFDLYADSGKNVNYYMLLEDPVSYQDLGSLNMTASAMTLSDGNGTLTIVKQGITPDNEPFIAGVVDGELTTIPGSYFQYTYNNTQGNNTDYNSDYYPTDGETHSLAEDDNGFFSLYNDTYTMVFPEMQEPSLKYDVIDNLHEWIEPLQTEFVDILYLSGYSEVPLINRTVTDNGAGTWYINGANQNVNLIDIQATYGYNTVFTTNFDLRWMNDQWDTFSITFNISLFVDTIITFDSNTGYLLDYSQMTEYSLMMNTSEVHTFYDDGVPVDVNVVFDFYMDGFQDRDTVINSLNFAMGNSLPGIDPSYPWGYDNGPQFMFHDYRYSDDYSSLTDVNTSILLAEQGHQSNENGFGVVNLGLAYTDANTAYYGVFGFGNSSGSESFYDTYYDFGSQTYNTYNDSWSFNDDYPVLDFISLDYNSSHPMIMTPPPNEIPLEDLFYQYMGFHEDMPDIAFNNITVPLIGISTDYFTARAYINNNPIDFTGLDIFYNYYAVINLNVYNDHFNYMGEETYFNYTVTVTINYVTGFTYDTSTNVLLAIYEGFDMNANSTTIISGVYDPQRDIFFDVERSFNTMISTGQGIFLTSIPNYYLTPSTTTNSTTSIPPSSTFTTSTPTTETTNTTSSETTDTNSTSPPEIPLGSYEITMQAVALGFIALVIIRKKR